MARRLDLKVRITAEDRASPVVDRTQTRFQKFTRFLRERFVFTLGDVTRAVQGITRALASTVEAAARAEQAQVRLETALGKTGSASEENVAALNAQADSLQNLAGVSNDAVTGVQAFLAELGVAPAQLQEATQASIDLASALGLSLEAAARNVGRTVGGFEGELSELIPELKDFTKEALQAGEGITFLAEKFAGTATQNAQNLQTQIGRLRNEIEDLQKAFVEGVGGIDQFTEGTSNLADELDRAEPLARGFGAALRTAVTESAAAQVTSFALRVREFVADLFQVSRAAAEAERGTSGFTSELQDGERAIDRFSDAILRANRAQREFAQAADEFESDLAKAGVSVRDTAAEIATLEDLLIRAGEGLRSAATDEEARRYALAIEAIEVKLRELREETVETTQALEAQNVGFEVGGRAASDYGRAVRRAANDQRVLNSVVSVGPVADLGARVSGVTTRDPRNQGLVDAAGARVVLGGTRVNLAGGGSRLLVPPSGSRA